MRSVRFAPFARPVSGSASVPVVPEAAADPPADDDLPPIEQFLDELPSIDDYLDEAAVETTAVAHEEKADSTVADHDSQGWATAGWQSYDWSGLAALAAPSSGRGRGTRWPNMEPDNQYAAGTGRGTDAEEVARVLDDLAYRIRSGELPIDQFTNQPPEAAMAAALAAVLRSRG